MRHLSSFYPDADTYIDSNYSNTNFCNYIVNWIGKKNCNTCYRTLLKFNIASIPEDAIITKAVLKLYVEYAQDPNAIGKFTPYAVTSPWKECAVTWNNCPSFDPMLAGSTESIGGVGWYEWDVARMIGTWLKKEQDNYGLLIKGNNKSMIDSKRLIGMKNTKCHRSEFRPILSVCYDVPQPASCDAMLMGRNFIEKATSVETTDNFIPTISFNTSQQSQVTFFVINTGLNPALVMLEVGPNDTDYVVDNTTFEVLPGSIIAVVPKIFAKYTRLIYKSKDTSQSTSLKIIFQSHV